MLRITQVRLPVSHTEEELAARIAARLRVPVPAIRSWTVERRSIDARKKPQLYYTYTVLAEIEREEKILRHRSLTGVSRYEQPVYRFPVPEAPAGAERPVIIGSGPAGLFCARVLAEHGFRPLVLERGDDVETRKARVRHFWESGELDPDSNVQFGEGGAGTFSDGKLYTGIHDPEGRIREVMRIFIEAGAPADILYDAHAHLGTDLLSDLVRNIRKQTEERGGEFRFRTRVTGLILRDGRVTGIRTARGETIDAPVVIAAVGHSARDTFRVFREEKVPMEPKPFAVGLRIQHEQQLITEAQFGKDAPAEAGAASYRLRGNTADGHAVYTFCMCPGGYILNASSEPGRLCVNGMSDRARDGRAANGAVITPVRPEDCAAWIKNGDDPVFAGLRFQEMLEEAAWRSADGRVPVQTFSGFCGKETGSLPVRPCIKGEWAAADVRALLPEVLNSRLEEGIRLFGRSLHGFDDGGSLLAGVETRTSSPVRILRDRGMESPVRGLFPCGEGAGYAGGITSAAVDGIRTAEAAAMRSNVK